jgi:uncharacterized membrane protein YkgB
VPATHRTLNCGGTEMSNPRPINLRKPSAKTRASSAQLGLKITIAALAVLIVSTLIAWLGLIGWGLVEGLRLTATAIYRLWTTFL